MRKIHKKDNFTVTSENWLDSEGRPEGGVSFGPGFTISWQKGPLGKGIDRVEPNGAFVKSVLLAVQDRIKFYQTTQFWSYENAEAIEHIEEALRFLNMRTQRRTEAGTEGTHEGN